MRFFLALLSELGLTRITAGSPARGYELSTLEFAEVPPAFAQELPSPLFQSLWISFAVSHEHGSATTDNEYRSP